MKFHFVHATMLSCLLFVGNVVAQSDSRIPAEAATGTPIVQEAAPSATTSQSISPVPMETNGAPMETNGAPIADSSCSGCNSGMVMNYPANNGCNSCSSGVVSYAPNYSTSGYSYGGGYDSGCCNSYSSGYASGYGGYWGWRRPCRPAWFGGWRNSSSCGCGY